MAGIGLISNPFSKKNRKNPRRLNKIKNLLPDQNLACFPTSFEEMDAAMAVFKKEDIDILAVNGGDGTIHIALSSLCKVYGDKKLPKLAILKGGTMNQTATASKIKGDTFEIFGNVCRKYSKKESFLFETKPLIKIDDKYGFIFGNGVVCNFMDIYHEGGDPSPFVALKSLLKVVFSMVVKGAVAKKLFAPLNMEIIADKFSFGYQPYMAMILASISEVGLGFELLPRAAGSIQSFQMVALKDKSKIVREIPRVWLGRALPCDVADDVTGREFIIKAQRPFRYTLDGDIYNSSGTLKIECGPLIDIIME